MVDQVLCNEMVEDGSLLKRVSNAVVGAVDVIDTPQQAALSAGTMAPWSYSDIGGAAAAPKL